MTEPGTGPGEQRTPRKEHGFPGPQDQPDAGALTSDRADELPSDVVEVAARSQWQIFRRKFFRHKLAMGSLIFLLLVVVAAFNAERIAPYAYDAINVTRANTPPTFADSHFFGTDQLGRDYFSRVLFGTQTSLRVAGTCQAG